ncbi:hypothetical protein ILUMI_13264 [Ignelater luminosus]|uniref:Peptidase A1 domain-containing protein n=1 Tax=Ignelater luminosus TaxID=2038154 RepID=A0A8K0CUU2_IGNLU|nr:hypothetical protein ILUMI_13264 [Ignelater luminosus]
MWRLMFAICCIFVLNQMGLVDSDTLMIPIFRQKSPREAALNSKDMHKLGIHLDWLRKHHHHNSTGNDSIALFRFLDMEFYGKVLIGQKGQAFNMLFDTAWQTSWVISNDCSWTTIGCWFHNKYDHTGSSTYVANGTKFISPEGSYNLTGYYSNDTFSIAHSRVNGQMFVEMTSVPYTYIFSKADGVMGLGIKTGKIDPFFYNMLRNGTIKQPLFSVYLSRDRQSQRGGNILLGFIDKKHIHRVPVPNSNKTIPDTITYLPVEGGSGYWQFHMDRIVLDMPSQNKSFPFCLHGCSTIADTTNNIILGPQQDINAIHTLIKAKPLLFGRSRVPCDTINKLPPIDFVLAGKNFTLKGPQYIQKMSYGSVTLCLSSFVSSSVPTEQNIWILGGAFLSQFYSIYDIGNNRIGFVRAASV